MKYGLIGQRLGHSFSKEIHEQIGKYEYDQWNKYAIEINSDTFTANVYVNGKLAKENVSIIKNVDTTDCTIAEIYRFKVAHSSSNTVKGAYSALDDFKVYVGKYNNSDDLVSVTSDEYIVKNNWIALSEEATANEFNSAVTMSNVKRKTVYDDASLTTTELYDEFDYVGHDMYVALETNGGAIHYYRIVDQNEATKVLGRTVQLNGNEVATDDELVLGKYVMNVEYEKYNNTEEKVNVILATYEGEKLVDVKLVEMDYEFGKNEVTPVDIDIEKSGLNMKAMLWQLDMKPIDGAVNYGVVSEG